MVINNVWACLSGESVIVMAMSAMLAAMPMTAVMTTVFALVVATAFVFMAISWCIVVVVPVIPDKIDAPLAGSILGAMPIPVAFITGRHTQVNWRFLEFWATLDNHRLLVNHLRLWIAAYIDLTIEARLANADRYSHLRKSRSCYGGEGQRKKRFTHNLGTPQLMKLNRVPALVGSTFDKALPLLGISLPCLVTARKQLRAETIPTYRPHTC